MKALKLVLATLLLTSIVTQVHAFCGFYVAQANSKLFNKSSQIILARDGQRTTVSMSSDYEGKLSEFAMVVPVPVVLKKRDIKTIDKSLFEKFDSYSAPRMAKYYDQAPCPVIVSDSLYRIVNLSSSDQIVTYCFSGSMEAASLGVTIEAEYKVDEYDILILSANESAGLETWLHRNGYKIPEGAREVLQPYIKDHMKFFVVKVNLARLKALGSNKIKPIQITYNSPKFMLPIRLGMANAQGDQDMIVYTLSKKGRVETTNYRNVKIPSNRNVPQFIQNEFGPFYKEVFDKTYKKYEGKVTFLEYAWDVSKRNPVKCDPCNGPAPVDQNLLTAGVSTEWITGNDPVFFTRMHVRYNRKNFPQDLMFQETSNREKFQGRYVIHTPANGPFECEEGQEYCKKMKQRRKDEVLELALLTGRDATKYNDYISEYDQYIKDGQSKGAIQPIVVNDDSHHNQSPSVVVVAFVIFLVIVMGVIFTIPTAQKKTNFSST